jgi:hypothetical protein
VTTETPTRQDVQLLLGEARLYLVTVDVFRAEGCQPNWRPEYDRVQATAPANAGILGARTNSAP